MTRERVAGWAGSVVVHSAVAAGLMAWSLQPSDDVAGRAGKKGSVAGGAPVDVVSPSAAAEPPAESASAGQSASSGNGPSFSPVLTEPASREADPDVVSSTRREVIFWLEWEGGADRRRVWAAVPEPGSGTPAGTHVRVRAVVKPDGTVARASASGGSDGEFRESSLSIVRRWRFTSLSSRRSGDQICTITFKVVPR